MLKPPTSDVALIEALLARNNAEVLVRSMNRIDDTAAANALRQLRFEESAERAQRAALTTEREATAEREAHEQRHEALAEHMDRHNRLEQRDAKMRLMVRRDTVELRDLEDKLRAAYVGQGIRAQLAEREAERLREKLEDERRLQEMLEQRQRDAEAAQSERAADKAKKLQFRRGLLEQMELHSNGQRRRYEEFLREKREIDDIVRRFYEESEREMHEQHARKQRFRDDLLALRDQQEQWSERQRRELAEEDVRIAAFLVEKNEREDERRRADAARLKGSSELAERMGAELMEAERKRLERQELLNMLKVEEMEEQAAQAARDQLAVRLRERLAARTEFVRQRADRAQRAQQAELDEREYRRQQMETLAERDRIEQLSNERKRQRIAEHNRIVLRMLADRRERRAAELAGAVCAEREADADREKLKQIVEEERIKILQEHAAALGGSFPRGVLRESDRAKLNL